MRRAKPALHFGLRFKLPDYLIELYKSLKERSADVQRGPELEPADAVHAKGGRFFLQLWHVGRQSHPDLQPNGEPPVAPSAIAAERYAYTRQGEVPFSMPRALALEEIPAIIEEFRAGAEAHTACRFDGVEIHGANG
jgi:2,4-dienoyl-CoA reductase-like NADH-dependent reductase (Old Yellow Enzyme family)